MKNVLVYLFLIFTLSSCSYLKHVSIQSEYAQSQKIDPRQVNLKHMIDRDNYFIIGQTFDVYKKYTNHHLAVAAYSSKFKKHERVDTMFFLGAGTHFGLNLPEGDYQLLVFTDKNNNKVFENTEIIGQKTISLNHNTSNFVLDNIEIQLIAPHKVNWVESIEKPNLVQPQKSLYFPAGTIRNFEDSIFSEQITTLGLYEPAAFLEKAPTMFYALEEDLGYKIPVVFVHGSGGSIRNFKSIVNKLDRERYKPWFFYYPSGGDLTQLAEIFHRIFLSGKVVKLNDMPMIIIAHSMGGLVVREAMNNLDNSQKENEIGLLVSVASPFGGHPSAALGEKYGSIVLPSWRDLNPENHFLKDLYRKPLPDNIKYNLIYAYDNPFILKISKNSDGVVPLSSQLRLEAQKQATLQLGYESSHTGILDNEEMIENLFDSMDKVKNFYPESHLKFFQKGGYDVLLSDDYGLISQYVIHTQGKYWMAVSNGTLKPFFSEQERFMRVIRGEEPPKYEVVKDWMRFIKEYPVFHLDFGE